MVNYITGQLDHADGLTNGQLLPLGSMDGTAGAITIEMSGFVTEDSTFEIVQYNIGTNGSNEDYQRVDLLITGSDDVVTFTAADLYYGFIGLRVVSAGTETTGIISVTGFIK